MKNLFSIAIVGLFATLLTACHSNPPQVVYVQPAAQPIAVQQPVAVQQDPNSFYSNPQYANQPPVMETINGNQVLVDAALVAYLTYYNISPSSYYTSHPGYAHFHVYHNGVYSGFAPGYHGYVTQSHYHYTAPDPKYLTKSGAPDMRYKVNQTTTTKTNTTVTPAAPAKTYSLRPSASTPPPAPQRPASSLSLRKNSGGLSLSKHR